MCGDPGVHSCSVRTVSSVDSFKEFLIFKDKKSELLKPAFKLHPGTECVIFAKV